MWNHKFAGIRGYAVPSTCIDKKQWIPHTDDTIIETLRSLQRKKLIMGPGAFEEAEIIAGFNHNDNSVLLGGHVKLASSIMYDWMHVYLVNGLLDIELGLCMRALHEHRPALPVSWRALGEYVNQWTFPKGSPKIDHLFVSASCRNNLKNRVFASSASELLTLVPVLLRFFAVVVLPLGACASEVLSIIACLESVELLHCVRRGIVSAHVLERYMHKHAEAFLSAWGEEHWKPKHHYSLHLPLQLARFGTLLSCFMHERKHRLVKRYCASRRKTESYELSIMEDISVHALHSIVDFSLEVGVTHGHTPSASHIYVLKELFPGEDINAMTLCRDARIQDGKASIGDVVYLREAGQLVAGEVLLHVRVRAISHSVVSVWQLIEHAHFCSTFRCRDEPRLLLTDCIQTSVTFSKSGGQVLILNTPEYRN